MPFSFQPTLRTVAVGSFVQLRGKFIIIVRRQSGGRAVLVQLLPQTGKSSLSAANASVCTNVGPGCPAQLVATFIGV